MIHVYNSLKHKTDVSYDQHVYMYEEYGIGYISYDFLFRLTLLQTCRVQLFSCIGTYTRKMHSPNRNTVAMFNNEPCPQCKMVPVQRCCDRYRGGIPVTEWRTSFKWPNVNPVWKKLILCRLRGQFLFAYCTESTKSDIDLLKPRKLYSAGILFSLFTSTY